MHNFVPKFIISLVFINCTIFIPYTAKAAELPLKNEPSSIIIEQLLGDVTNKLDNNNRDVNFYVFVSFSLTKQNLVQLIEFGKKYNAIFVLRGLKAGSFSATSGYIQDINDEVDDASFIIDPTLFEKYAITTVPSFVLVLEKPCIMGTSCHVVFDKIAGNITPLFALKKFAASGDIVQAAQDLLGGIYASP